MYSNFQVEKDNSYNQNKEYNINNSDNNNSGNNNSDNNNSGNNGNNNNNGENNSNNSNNGNNGNNNNNDSNNNGDNNGDNNNNGKNNKKIISAFKNFLNGKSDTILTVAGATAIAFAFKDLVLSVATNIIHPLFRLLIISFKLNNYVDMGELNKSQNMGKNIMNFLTTLVSFISVVLITYYSIKGLNDTFNILDNMQ
jgi:large-conductance mechanosensitive channel